MLASRCRCAILLIVLLVPAPAVAATVHFVSGQPAPGLPGRTLGSLFQPIFLNGELGFTGRIDDASRRIWVPDGNGGLVSFPDPSDSTSILNLSSTAAGVLINRGAGQPKRVTPQGIIDLIPAGAPAPGTDGTFTTDDQFPRTPPTVARVTPDGTIYFAAALDGPGVDARNDQGIWRLAPGGELSLVVREGVDFFSPDGEPFLTVGPNGAGTALHLRGLGAEPSQLFAFAADGTTRLIAEEGVLAPGTELPFTEVGVGSIGTITQGSDASDVGVAFVGQLGDRTNVDDGVWFLEPGADDPSILLRTGDVSPGGDALIQRLLTVDFNADGLLGVAGDTERGRTFWLRDPDGNIEEAFTADTDVPGLPEGARFFAFAVDEGGDLIVSGRVADTPVGILVRDGVPRLLSILEGSEFEVAPGDTRIVSASFGGRISPDRRRVFNTLFFEDGTAAIVSFAIPEPSVGWLLAVGIAAACGRRAAFSSAVGPGCR